MKRAIVSEDDIIDAICDLNKRVYRLEKILLGGVIALGLIVGKFFKPELLFLAGIILFLVVLFFSVKYFFVFCRKAFEYIKETDIKGEVSKYIQNTMKGISDFAFGGELKRLVLKFLWVVKNIVLSMIAAFAGSSSVMILMPFVNSKIKILSFQSGIVFGIGIIGIFVLYWYAKNWKKIFSPFDDKDNDDIN